MSELVDFTRIIREMEAEIVPEYLGGCIAWADREYDNAFSKAINRLDSAISEAVLMDNYKKLEVEAEIYKHEVLKFCKLYKVHKNLDDTQMFLFSLSNRSEMETA